ncbi:MAG: zinc ribbon domain-containing protein [Candidatus Omnitrophica bacterium]|nr:hypothetical protein [bacterium]NUN97297.1 zinc ribbon domain-containing protein [Candidatus Omnitrophota bacterium]
MPLVEYSCEKCSTLFEILQGVTQDAEEAVCPSCGSKKVQKALSTFRAATAGGSSAKDSFTPAATRCSPGCACHN